MFSMTTSLMYNISRLRRVLQVHCIYDAYIMDIHSLSHLTDGQVLAVVYYG